ncbi:zinc ribbon domain-containing protein, partial [Paenibacillus enshidis]
MPIPRSFQKKSGNELTGTKWNGGADPFTRERPADKTGDTLLKDLLFCGICGRKLKIDRKNNGTFLIMPCRKVLPDSGITCNNQGVKLQSLEEEVLQQL